MKRLFSKATFPLFAAYIVGSFAYSAAFYMRMRAKDPSSYTLGFVQIVLLAVSPIWFPLHIGLVILCTVSGGRGGWDADNTASFVVFAAAFGVTYILARALKGKVKTDEHA